MLRWSRHKSCSGSFLNAALISFSHASSCLESLRRAGTSRQRHAGLLLGDASCKKLWSFRMRLKHAVSTDDPNPHFTKPPHNKYFHTLKHQKYKKIQNGGIFATTCSWRRALSLSLSSLVLFFVCVRLWHCDCLQGWLVVVLAFFVFFLMRFANVPLNKMLSRCDLPFLVFLYFPEVAQWHCKHEWMDGLIDWFTPFLMTGRSGTRRFHDKVWKEQPW